VFDNAHWVQVYASQGHAEGFFPMRTDPASRHGRQAPQQELESRIRRRLQRLEVAEVAPAETPSADDAECGSPGQRDPITPHGGAQRYRSSGEGRIRAPQFPAPRAQLAGRLRCAERRESVHCAEQTDPREQRDQHECDEQQMCRTRRRSARRRARVVLMRIVSASRQVHPHAIDRFTHESCWAV
jgi:hypothetical protein